MPSRDRREATENWDLWRHIDALRKALFRGLAGWVLCSAIAWNWWESLWKLLELPLKNLPHGPRLIVTSPTGAVETSFQVALVAGSLLSAPWVGWQIWRFVSPALFPRERHLALQSMLWTVLLFAAGVATGFATIVPMTLRWLAEYGSGLFEAMWTVDQYTSMVVRLLLGFGVMFEFPLLTWVLGSLGVVTGRRLLSWSRGAIVAIFVVAAVLTPPDPVSQCIMAAPMLVLYFAGVVTATLAGRRRKKEA